MSIDVDKRRRLYGNVEHAITMYATIQQQITAAETMASPYQYHDEHKQYGYPTTYLGIRAIAGAGSDVRHLHSSPCHHITMSHEDNTTAPCKKRDNDGHPSRAAE